MKTVILIRHGKSSWNYDVSDQERPLKTRGIEDIKRVAKAFKQYGFVPDKIASSFAKRALDTCKIFMKQLDLEENLLEINPDLYDFSGESVVEYIKSVQNVHNTIIIFGHNHAFTSISNTFGNKYIENVPTSGLVKISFDITSWEDIKKGHTDLIIFPKDLRLKNG